MIDDDDPVGESVGLVEVVGRQDDRLAAALEAADLVPEGSSGRRVEADGRLVEEERVGIAADGEREVDALALAARELAHQAALELAQPCHLHHLVGGKRLRVVGPEEVDDLADLKRQRDAGLLQHDPDPRPGSKVAGLEAEESGGTGGRPAEPQHQADRGRLAGAVGP